MAKLLAKQGLQALDPLAALHAFLPRALREVTTQTMPPSCIADTAETVQQTHTAIHRILCQVLILDLPEYAVLPSAGRACAGL